MAKRSKKIVLGIIIALLVVIIGGAGAAYFYVHNLLGKIDQVEINEDNIVVEEHVSTKLSKYEDTITNIALFGIDAEQGGTGRSDAIMIATVDTTHKKLKLTSIMRDSYVDIDGHGKDKINHAYAFGGPELAISTINKNFDLNIKDFVAVNFSTMPKIIDAIGGVEINITNEEVPHLRSLGITSTGMQHLNGQQALAYSRIRYASGGDYMRTQRQRTVLSAIFNKVIKMSTTELTSLLNTVLPLVQTSMPPAEILEMGTEVIKMGVPSVEQNRFPLDGKSQGKMINGVYYLTFDIEATANEMHDYIFEDKIN